MASAPVLDFSALTQPIPGDAPEGRTVPLPVRQKLGAARKETEPHPDDPNLGEVPRKADWPGIVRTVEDLLTNTSKDLLLVAQLTEALTRLHGFAGVRDGLHLFYELVEQCWDRVHPMPEEGEGMDVRTGPFHWLSDADRGARFPNTVREVSMLRIDNQTYSWMDWKCSQEGKPLVDGRDPVPAADFDRALPLSPDVAEDLTQANDELTRLEQKLDALMGADAPGMMGLRQALEDCAQLMRGATGRGGGGRARPQRHLPHRLPRGRDRDDRYPGGGVPADRAHRRRPGATRTPQSHPRLAPPRRGAGADAVPPADPRIDPRSQPPRRTRPRVRDPRTGRRRAARAPEWIKLPSDGSVPDPGPFRHREPDCCTLKPDSNPRGGLPMSAAEQAQAAAAATTTTEDAGSKWLEDAIKTTRPRTDQESQRTRNYLEEYVRHLIQPGMVVSRDAEANIKYWIKEIDKKLTDQLNAVMHHEEDRKSVV